MIATILLTRENQYLRGDGSLPMRSYYDKKLLRAICSGNEVSQAGYQLLPPSIKVHTDIGEPEVGITIPEIDSADLLIISRSNDSFKGGKVFRLDNFIPIVIDSMIEIWRHK